MTADLIPHETTETSTQTVRREKYETQETSAITARTRGTIENIGNTNRTGKPETTGNAVTIDLESTTYARMSNPATIITIDSVEGREASTMERVTEIRTTGMRITDVHPGAEVQKADDPGVGPDAEKLRSRANSGKKLVKS